MFRHHNLCPLCLESSPVDPIGGRRAHPVRVVHCQQRLFAPPTSEYDVLRATPPRSPHVWQMSPAKITGLDCEPKIRVRAQYCLPHYCVSLSRSEDGDRVALFCRTLSEGSYVPTVCYRKDPNSFRQLRRTIPIVYE
jgi:hypothetical protein